MRVILEIASGPAAGRKIYLRDGEAVQLGRTELSDVSIPDDPLISSRHFAVECQANGCVLRDLGSTNGTAVNGQPVSEPVALADGDQIVAGQTRFAVTVQGTANRQPAAAQQPAEASEAGRAGAGDDQRPPVQAAGAEATAGAAPQVAVADQPLRGQDAAELCGALELDEAARELLTPGQSPLDYLQRLAGAKLWTDAVRFWAAALPLPSAVLWAAQCVRQSLGQACSAEDARALEAAEAWALDSSEENRRAAEQAAQATEFQTAASWVALAAFWSGGSLAPAGLPEVPPGPELAPKAIAGALMMAATGGPAEQVEPRYASYLEAGQEIVQRASD